MSGPSLLTIQLNGEPRTFEHDISVSQLILGLNLASDRIAVEVNRQVLRKQVWPDTILQNGDRVEIVHFVGGGDY
jgi:thiamine biosynthesis protein ThiS